jgi:hypothetical protein
MGRYGIKRSPYSDEEQARAIELYRAGVQEDTILDILAKEFPNERSKRATLTGKVIKKWAKAYPNFPETMRELGHLKKLKIIPPRRARTFKQVAFEESVRSIVHSAVFSTFAAIINNWPKSTVIE